MTHEELERLSPTELIKIIMRLQERIVSLEEQVASLQERLEQLAKPPKTSRNSSVPSSKSDKPNRKRSESAKPRGPKPGHEGHSRTRQTPDVVIECRPTVCAQCGHDLTQVDQAARGISQVVDIPPIEPIVVEAHRFCATCPSCGHAQVADYPAGLEPERVFGPQVETLVTYFHHVHHLSYERLAQVLAEVFGLEISQGAIDNILQRTAQHLEPEAEEIRQTVTSSRIVGSDETGVRVDGQNHWQWVFQTSQASYYVIDKSRGAQVIRDVMEEAVPEVWVSDLFSAQLSSQAPKHQICHAHQLRDLQYAIDAERSAFAYQMQQLLLRSQRLFKHRLTLPANLFQQQVRCLEGACDALLSMEVRPETARRLQKRYMKHREHLFVFLYEEGVPNAFNGSERALRNSVVHRKVLAGFRSGWGARAFATVTTVIETARKEGHRLFEALRALLGPPMPQAPANRSP
jgi:transposase